MSEARTVQNPGEFPAEHGEFLLRGPAGMIECAVDVPEAEEARRGTVIICHPHPEHGGTMHNKVVTIIERAMRELGLRTVRFNFRGVGKSEGAYDDGYGETDDLFAVAEWVRRTRPDDSLWLAGFSFGAAIAVRAAVTLDIDGLVSVAPAIYRFAGNLEGQPDCPWLIIQGDEDELVEVDETVEWADSLAPGPELLIMTGAEHFFHGRLQELREAVTEFVKPYL